jgi:hypothetical protein
MSDLSDAIFAVTKSVTKEWTRQRKAEEKGSRSRQARVYVYSDRVCFTDVAEDILPGAYAHASGDGTYSVSKRTFYYACRNEFQERTGQPLKYEYFANTLLVQFLNQNPDLTAGWRVTADPRGTLTIPNAKRPVRVPVGTLQIDNHLAGARGACDPYAEVAEVGLPIPWPSLAGGQRYQAVLYIEKEGFEPLLEDAQIAERYGLAVISCKGQSVVAARKFVDEVCAAGGGVPLLVVHDFDKAGFEISQRLTSVSEWARANDRVTYRFQNVVDVHDLGLRLSDVDEYGLEDKAEDCEFKGYFAADSIATPEEQEFLQSGRRVELNAFTSPQFIEWLEAKLNEHLPGRLIPSDTVLVKAYRRALAVAQINEALEDLKKTAIDAAKAAKVPKSLRRRLQKTLRESDRPWDAGVYELAKRQATARTGG